MTYQNTMSFRMVQMQVMNTVNTGVSKGVSVSDIETCTNALIDATQLFLKDSEVKQLRLQLNERIEAQKIIV